MEFYGSGGEYLGLVPDCPKRTLGNPGSGDDFVTDGNGNLYQIQLTPSWWERESAKGSVKIWKWERIK